MTRKIKLTVAALTLGLGASTATAFWPNTAPPCNGPSPREIGRQQNEMWPYPYVCPDREWVAAPFETMTYNGWRQQNLLGAHHFDEETNHLTRAGELKVRWILTQAPEQRRQVFVERAVDPAVTEQRLASAREYSAIAGQPGQVASVSDTHVVSPGRPAASVDLVNQSYRENMLPAVLPALTTETAGQ